MKKTPLYGIWSWAYGQWNLLYQYPRTYILEQALRTLAKARENYPSARLEIREVPKD